MSDSHVGLLPSLAQVGKSSVWLRLKPGATGDGERTTDHLAKEFLRSVSKERHTAHQELVEDDAHGPPVHWLAVALAEDHLGCDVLGCPAYLGQAEWGN